MGQHGGFDHLRAIASGITLAKNEGNTAQLRLRISADILHQLKQFQKREIHTVFPRFRNFELAQNLSLSFLAELCGVALTY